MFDFKAFFGGLVLGWFIEKYFLDKIQPLIHSKWQKRRYERINSHYSKYNDIMSDLELIQSGWTDKIFNIGDVEITHEREFILDSNLKSEINYEKKEKEWIRNNLKNNQLIGVTKIDPHRLSENIGGNSHLLHISAQQYHYFDFLATGRILSSGSDEEKELILKYLKEDGYTPQPNFPNPLSVGLTVFCQKGDYIVLGKRSTNVSTGGDWEGGKLYNAVGENANLSDIDNSYKGFSSISPWKTAKRGLSEELGLIERTNNKEAIQLHSFVYDKRVYDYKFFGYFISGFSIEEVRHYWIENASDKESIKLDFIDVSTSQNVKNLIKRMINDKDKIAIECMFSTIRSFLFMGKISLKELLKIIND